jgi:hypothetical protein
MTRTTLCTALSMLGAGVGLVLSAVLNAPRGLPHHCPAGSSPSSCTYPPNMLLWRFEWLIGGLLLGLLLGIVAALAIGDRLPSSSRRSPFYHAH